MARYRKEVDEQLLSKAKEEFLMSGYEEASLRKIAEGAETSTNAIYVRYSNKQGLYLALVEGAADGLKQLLKNSLEISCSLGAEYPVSFYREHYRYSIPRMLDYIYCHFDAFRLLAVCGRPQGFRNYTRDLARIELECTKEIAAGVWDRGTLPDELLLYICQSFYTGLFETVIHNMPKDRTDALIGQLTQYYVTGWNSLAG